MKVEFKAPKRPVNRVFLHCSASDLPSHDNVQTMRQWHIEKGYKDDWGKPEVGYHFYIRKDGTLEIGRNLESNPDAQAGHNKGTIAICLGGLKKEKFTQAQFLTLRELCEAIHQQLPLATFHGHKEVSARACPVFDYRKELGLDAKGRLTT